jgi:outer membrane protein
MTRVFVGFCVAVLGLTTLSTTQAEGQGARFGYINLQRAIAEAPGTADAEQAFERDMQMYRAELERLEAELETLQENFERQQGTMTATVREERQLEMQQKFFAYQQRQMELEETAQRRQSELLGPIMERIMSVTEAVRQEGSYAMIFDAAAGALVTADPALDITEQVLQRLRAP